MCARKEIYDLENSMVVPDTVLDNRPGSPLYEPNEHPDVEVEEDIDWVLCENCGGFGMVQNEEHDWVDCPICGGSGQVDREDL